MAEKPITIGDIAKALGVSKTTVSRAISGKGRISEETIQRVNRYIEKHNYRPNSIAKSLAESKSYNIGFVMPKDYGITDLPFYQKCLWGISQVAMDNDYDVLVTIVSDNDISQLSRVVTNNKVDGIILGRTSSENTIEQFLRSKNVPFVTVGSSVDSTVLQVDNDHESACCDLMTKLLKSGIRDIALIGMDTKYIVNRNRYHGYRRAFENLDLQIHEDRIYLSKITAAEVEEAVDDILKKDIECIVCMDDEVCTKVLNKLNRDHIRIPEDIKVASFYNSNTLGYSPVKITAINFDETKLGQVSAKMLFDQINKEEPIKKVLLGYEIDLRESTGHKKK